MRFDRRQFIWGLGGAVALAAGGARAEIACQPYGEGSEICQVGLRLAPEAITAQQECEFWCWAACIESIFALRGFAVSQAEIVQRVYDQPICAPAVGTVIAEAASGDWQARDGRRFRAETEVLIDANRASSVKTLRLSRRRN